MMTRGTLNYGNSHLTSNNRDSTGQDGPSGNFSENAMGDGLWKRWFAHSYHGDYPPEGTDLAKKDTSIG